MNNNKLPLLLETAHIKPAIAVTAISTVACLLYGASASQALLVFLAVLSGQFSIGLSNNYFDRHNDKKSGRTDKAIVNGVFEASSIITAASILLGGSIIFSVLLDTRFAVFHMATVTIGWAYNIILKNTPASILCYMTAFSLIPFFAAQLSGITPAPFVVISFAFLGSTMHFADALKDYDFDNKAGIRGFPNIFPLQTSKRIFHISALLCITSVIATAIAL